MSDLHVQDADVAELIRRNKFLEKQVEKMEERVYQKIALVGYRGIDGRFHSLVVTNSDPTPRGWLIEVELPPEE